MDSVQYRALTSTAMNLCQGYIQSGKFIVRRVTVNFSKSVLFQSVTCAEKYISNVIKMKKLHIQSIIAYFVALVLSN